MDGRRIGMQESCKGGRRMRDIKFSNDFLVPFLSILSILFIVSCSQESWEAF